ncbi:MAG: LysE family translocator [Sneathiella sp.]|nr:LysE family translocator [Sneathiella sp.]
MSVEAWLVFVGIWTLAGMPLGPNALNCISVSATAGFTRSLWTIVGICLAALCHMTATVLGIAAILLANAELFQIMKYLGAAYLIWMGIFLWHKKSNQMGAATSAPRSAVKIVRQSFLISMTNPKAVISYLAVFSQFVDQSRALTEQMFILVPTATIITASIYAAYCAIGMTLTRFLSTIRRRNFFNRFVGSFYIAAGAGLALVDIKPSLSAAPQISR